MPKFVSDSAREVVFDAVIQRLSGVEPELGYILEEDPAKAASLAREVLLGEVKASLADSDVVAATRGKKYPNLSDAELKSAVRHIVRTSMTETEIRRRVMNELGYPHEFSLFMETPMDRTGEEARELVRGLGGLVTKSGAMVMGMMHGAEGLILL
jgi:hypothetical protein